MRFAHVLAAAVLVSPLGAFGGFLRADTIEIDPDSFAAIAYCPSTGEFHYAYGYDDRWSAQKAAMDRCKAKDARIVCWVNEGFCALALGDDNAWGVGYSYGGGSNNTEAMNNALEECKKRTTGAHVVVCLSSDGQYIHKPEPRPAVKQSEPKADTPAGATPPPAEKPKPSPQPSTTPN